MTTRGLERITGRWLLLRGITRGLLGRTTRGLERTMLELLRLTDEGLPRRLELLRLIARVGVRDTDERDAGRLTLRAELERLTLLVELGRLTLRAARELDADLAAGRDTLALLLPLRLGRLLAASAQAPDNTINNAKI